MRFCLLALLLAHLCLHATSAGVDANGPAPVVRSHPPGFQHALTDEDLQPLFKTCMDPDFAPHDKRVKYQKKPYSLLDLANTVVAQKRAKYYKHLSLVVIRQGAMHIATLSPSKMPPSPTPKRIAAMQGAVANATKAGVQFPDCVFIMSTWDEPRCPLQYPALCTAPIMSIIKQWDPSRKSSIYTDILVPFFNHFYEDVVDFPWELKKNQALMRGAMQNGMSPNNVRLWLVRQSEKPPWPQLLDAGITNNLKRGLDITTVPQVSMPDHARWRFLISTDGFTASARLGKVLGINSVVVKEETRWIEHYYRALVPDTHYVGFTRSNALQVLQDLHKKPDDKLQAIAQAGQQFQQQYLSQQSKAVYLQKVLQRYVTLFPASAHPDFVARLDVTRLTDLSYLLEQLKIPAAIAR